MKVCKHLLKYKPHMIVLLSVLAALITGCGVRNAMSHPDSSGGKATASFTINWPSSSSRTIPSGTNRIIIYVNGPGIRGSVAYIVDKVGIQNSTNIQIELPAGSKRLFSAEARKVNSIKYTTATRIPLNSPDLSEGTLLGSGNDGDAHDIPQGAKISASIDIGTAGTPGAGVASIKVTVNQILTDCFPAVLVLQIIRDQNGNPISNLSKGNFTVTEDGQTAVITDVRTVTQARSDLSVGLVLDRSGSMDGTPNSDLESAATIFVNQMQQNDAAEIINFSSSVNVTQCFTSDNSALISAIENHYIGEMTALYDAMLQGVNDTSARSGRKAVLAMTDGWENQSSHNLNDVLTQTLQAGLPIFTIGLGDTDTDTLQYIADQTGGIYSYAPTSSDLNAIYTKISNQLAAQIQISFVSPDTTPSGKNRHVVVDFHYGSLSGQATYDYVF